MRQSELGLETAKDYERVVTALVSIHLGEDQLDGQGPTLEEEFVSIGVALASVREDKTMNVHLQSSFKILHSLLLLSYCHVRRRRQVNPEKVDTIRRHIANQENDCRRIMKGALWINSVINKMVVKGWTIQRATELFFIGEFMDMT